MQRQLNANSLANSEDWEGNNAAFTCPLCGKVYIVSASKAIHKGRRSCPNCGKSEGVVVGGKKSGGTAAITW